MQKIEYRCSLAECTVSSGADRSERSEDKKGTKNFWQATFLAKKFADRTLGVKNVQIVRNFGSIIIL